MKKYRGFLETSSGIIEVIADDKSVFEIKFSDKTGETSKESKVLEKALTQLKEYFRGERKEFDIPLHLEGTEFQKNTWNQLKKIPYGETVSYQDIAVALNNEKAVRAVGNANNKNKIMIVIPCHRVVGKNGKLVGYAGGLDKKEFLLEHEKKFKD